MFSILWNSIKLGWSRLVSRRLYLFIMIVVPLGVLFFMTDFMAQGLPVPVPTLVVDMDQSSMSRQVVRLLQANQFVDIEESADSYAQAMDQVNRGEKFGFFYIPRDFQKKTLAGEEPTLTLYSNMSFFVPGTMAFKGFKTVGVSTAGAVVKTTLVSAGISDVETMSMIQPVVVQDHPLNNPWLNYEIYLNNSFIPGILVLMIMLTTAWSVCEEIKRGTGPEALKTSGGSIIVALAGKLLPQTLIFSVLGIFIQAWMFKFQHYPLNCPPMHVISAMILLVIASQSFAVLCCEATPNLRLALVLTAMTGILSFSVLGFSMPVQQMYGGVAIFSWLMPLRYYFLIYIDQALNGIPMYYSRWYYAALCLYPLLALIGLRRIKARYMNPVYIP